MRDEVFNKIFPSLRQQKSARAPMIAADHLANLINTPLDEICKNGLLLAKGLITAKKLYHNDFLIVFSDIAVEAEAMGVKLEYHPSRNPHVVENLEPSQFKQCRMSQRGRLPELFTAAQLCKDHQGEEFSVFISMKDPFSLAAMLLGTEEFLISLTDDPVKALELIEICAENQVGLVRDICSEGFIPLIGAPISSGSLIGPRWFEKFAMKSIQRLVDEIHNLNTSACMHICGEVSPLVDQLPELNLDLLSFEEFYTPLWERMPETVPMGYVSTDLFSHGNAESVAEATRNCLQSLPEPFVLSTACDLPANAKPDLVKIMMETNLNENL